MLKKLVYRVIGDTNVLLLQSALPSINERHLRKKRREFYLQFLKKGDLFFDVGANYGNRILPIINEGIKIVAFEPQRECVDFLKRRFRKGVQIEEIGLDQSPGTKTFFVAAVNTLSTFSTDWIAKTKQSGRFGENVWDQTRSIEMSTLDLMIEKYGLPAFVKIDVEGFEVEVLKGLHVPIKHLSIEYAVPEHLEQASKCIEIMSAIYEGKLVCNYSIGETMEWALQEWLNPEEFEKHLRTDDFIATQFGDIYFKQIM